MTATVSPSAPARARVRTVASIVLPPVVAAGCFVGLWYFFSKIQFDTSRRRNLLQPYPHDVVKAGFLTSRNLTELLHALWRTTQVSLLGLGVSMVLGVALAIVMNMSRSVERTLYPYAVVLQTIPIVAITPLIINWFGTGQMPRVIVCVLISVFPIITNTLFGLKSPDRGQRDLFKLHHGGRLTRLVKLELPAAQPAMFTGFRIAAGLSVIGAIVGEFFFKEGKEGLGRRILQYTNVSQTNRMIAAIVMAAALGYTLFAVFGWIANRATRTWRPEAGPRR